MVLPKSMRLKGHKCFDYLHKSGIRYHGPSILLRVVKAKPQLLKSSLRDLKPHQCRCAVAISTKVSKKAVIRNRLRRLLHDRLKERLLKIPTNENGSSWALLSLKPSSSQKGVEPLMEECDSLLREAGLI